MDIKSLISKINNEQDLKNILLSLRLYKDLIRKLWKRWKDLYKNYLDNVSSYKVEYFSSLWLEFAKEESLKVYKSIFKDNIELSRVKFIVNNNIFWWIRVYKDDNVVDISYKKVWEALTKS